MYSTRDKFEQWYQEEITGCNGVWLEKFESGEYIESDTKAAWIVWQKATEIALKSIKAHGDNNEEI